VWLMGMWGGERKAEVGEGEGNRNIVGGGFGLISAQRGQS
jgi:hypothetical protein